MKFTPEVQAALQTLKNAAENDFERHRIDVLERDLTAPPKVEVIDENHQKFNGVVYTKYTTRRVDNHYYRPHSLHRVVYLYYYGEIPDGYSVHHKDGNAANNDIGNLQLVTKEEHISLHRKMLEASRKTKKFVCLVCKKEYEALDIKINKFCSSKCREKYYQKFRRTLIKKNCAYCGKEFELRIDQNQQCCSRSCASKLMWKNKTTSN